MYGAPARGVQFESRQEAMGGNSCIDFLNERRWPINSRRFGVKWKLAAMKNHSATARIPFWLKVGYTFFMIVLVPVYWANYGLTNFLYFCDIALFITLFAVWKESRLAASMAAVGILVPQLFWCLDFGIQIVREISGAEHSGMTAYMFDGSKSAFLRGLSLFHGWLPFLLIFLVSRLGYDPRALKSWTLLAWILCLFSFFLLPPAGATLTNPNMPLNVNYVFGLDDSQKQTWMPDGAYLGFWMLTLFFLAYLPTHGVLNKLANRRKAL